MSARTACDSDAVRPTCAQPTMSRPEIAAMDSLVCSLADGFLGTRGSMFSRNILEERVLQGKRPATGSYMA